MNRGPSLVMSDHDGDGTDPGPGPDKGEYLMDMPTCGMFMRMMLLQWYCRIVMMFDVFEDDAHS